MYYFFLCCLNVYFDLCNVLSGVVTSRVVTLASADKLRQNVFYIFVDRGRVKSFCPFGFEAKNLMARIIFIKALYLSIRCKAIN